MKITKEMPVSGTVRTRQVFASLPTWFNHGSLDKPLRTMVWFDYYTVEERFNYGYWLIIDRRLSE